MDGPYPSQNGIAISIEPQDFSRVLFVDFLLIFDRCRDVVDDADRFADKAGAFFWVEGHVGAKQHMIRAEECEAAFGRGQGSAQGRVSVKHSKIVKRPFSSDGRVCPRHVHHPSLRLYVPRNTESSLAYGA